MSWAFATSWRLAETVAGVSVVSSAWKRKIRIGHTKVSRAHVEDLEDPGEVQSPGDDRFFIVLFVEEPRDRIPFPPLDDLLLDLCHSTAIQGMVNKSYARYISVGPTYTVNRSIAPRTVLLNSFMSLPFIPRSRAMQTSAQASPRPTQSTSLIIASCILH